MYPELLSSFPHMLLEPGNRPALHPEHLEELVVERLRLALLIRSAPPLTSEPSCPDPDLIPRHTGHITPPVGAPTKNPVTDTPWR